MLKSSPLLHLGCMLLATLPLVPQTSTDSAIQQLRTALLRESQVTVAVSGLHVTAKVLLRPIDNRIVNGAVQSRALVGVLRGSDDRLLQPGDPVRVLAVESTSDAKNDILRLTIATSNGARAPIAFVLPGGSLASMSEPQLRQTITPILNLSSPAAGAPNSPAAVAPATHAASAGWVVQPFPFGREAHIAGMAETGGRRVPAVLALRCFNRDANAENRLSQPTSGTPLLDLRLRRADLTYDISSLDEKDGDDNAYMHLQLGGSPELTIDLSTYSSAPDKAPVAELVPDLRVAELQQILQATGTTLRVTLASPDIPAASTITAQFNLPADASPARTTMDSCLQHAEAQAAALRSARPVACPTRPGLVLVDGTVRYAANGKAFPVVPDRDQGVGWDLPKPTKAHPTPPKLNLVCGYALPNPAPVSANTGASARKATESLTLPIPPSLAGGGCETWTRVAETRSESYCEMPNPPGQRR